MKARMGVEGDKEDGGVVEVVLAVVKLAVKLAMVAKFVCNT